MFFSPFSLSSLLIDLTSSKKGWRMATLRQKVLNFECSVSCKRLVLKGTGQRGSNSNNDKEKTLRLISLE